MSVRTRVAAAAVSLGALGVAGPIAASSAATVPATSGGSTVAPIISTDYNAALAALTTDAQTAQGQFAALEQTAQGQYASLRQTALDNWQTGIQAGVRSVDTASQAAQSGIAAGAAALGLPAGP